MDWLCCTILRSMEKLTQKKIHGFPRGGWRANSTSRSTRMQCFTVVWYSFSLLAKIGCYDISPACFSSSFFNSYCWIIEQSRNQTKAINQSRNLHWLPQWVRVAPANEPCYFEALIRSKLRLSLKFQVCIMKPQATVNNSKSGNSCPVIPDLLFSGTRPTSMSSSLTWLFSLLP